MASIELHRARFVEWNPSSVVALAATPDGAAVAVGREDGSVELHDVTQDWRCVARAPGCEGASLTALAWTAAAAGQLQLVSSSLNGQLVTWDLQVLRPLATTDSTGGPVWHIAAQPLRDRGGEEHQQLAVACDDGSLRVFGASESGLVFRRACARVGARLLSTAWHPDGSTVVAGSSDGCLRCWDSRSGAELLRLTLARGLDAGMPACVWAVLVLPDGTLVSGDSEGRTCLWDGAHGTLLHAVTAHDADVLALACNPAGDVVFSAGIDSKVACLGSTQGDGVSAATQALPPWALLGYKRAHTHDVRVLVTAPFPQGSAESTGGESAASAGDGLGGGAFMLLSAGTDAQIIAYAADNFVKEHPVRVVRAPPGPCLSVASAAGELPLMLCTYATWLDLWRLGASSASTGHHAAASLELAAAPTHLARIHVRCKRHLVCSTLSADGRWAAASDAFAPHLFAVALPPDVPRPKVTVRQLPESLPAAVDMVITPDQEHLVLASPAGTVHLVALGAAAGMSSRVLRHHLTVRSDLKPAADTRHLVTLPSATHVRVSHDSKWLAVAVAATHSGPFKGAAAQCNCVCVYSLDTLRVHASLPLPTNDDVAPPVVALSFTPDSGALLVANAEDVLLLRLGAAPPAWSDAGLGASALSSRLGQMSGPLQGLSLDPQAGLAAVLLHSAFAICHVDFTRPLTQRAAQPAAKRRRVNGVAAQQQAQGVNGRVVTLQQPCLLAAYFKPGAAVLVERPWEEIMRALPAPLFRKRFGM